MSEHEDPPRLVEADPNSPVGRALDAARRDLPTDAQLASLAERLGPTLGAAPVATSVPLGVKLGVLAGVAALVAAGALLARKHATSPSSEPPGPAVSAVNAPATSVAELSPSEQPAAAPSASAEPAISAVTATSSHAPHPSPPSEAALLERARRALATDPEGALTLTNQDAALYPHGVLVQEREVIAIEALRRLNRSAEADRRAAAFGRAFPGSAHQRTVHDSSAK